MSSEASNSKEPVIRCENVYKIFGENAKRMMKESGGEVDVSLDKEGNISVKALPKLLEASALVEA